MQTSVTFKNIDPSDHLRTYVSEKLDRFDKYLNNPAEANVVLAVEKFRHIAEINISGDRLTINGKEETSDMYSAIDMALDKVEIQIKKSKEKIKQHRVQARSKNLQNFDDVDIQAEDGGLSNNNPQINIMTIDYKPMDVEEAAMQLELANDNFLVFKNARSNEVNVIYKQKAGNLGLIQPNR